MTGRPSNSPQTNSAPVACYSWITPQLIDQTIRVWSPHYQRTLSPDEAIEILISTGRLLDVLDRQNIHA